jgi:hypothetical protein
VSRRSDQGDLGACQIQRALNEGVEGRTVGDCFAEEQSRLLALPACAPQTDDVRGVVADKTALIRFDCNDYSAPHTIVGKTLTVGTSDSVVRVLHVNVELAHHMRNWERKQLIEFARHTMDPNFSINTSGHNTAWSCPRSTCNVRNQADVRHANECRRVDNAQSLNGQRSLSPGPWLPGDNDDAGHHRDQRRPHPTRARPRAGKRTTRPSLPKRAFFSVTRTPSLSPVKNSRVAAA